MALTDEEGRVGYGKATPLSQFTGETAGTTAFVLKEVVLPAMEGLDCFDIAADCAMYDLAAKTPGVPLYNLLNRRSS